MTGPEMKLRLAILSALILMIMPQTLRAFPLETRFGTLEIVENPVKYDGGLSFNGQQIDGVIGSFTVMKHFEWGERGDVILLRGWSGGASCCTSFQIVRITATDALATPVFGAHGREPSGFSVDKNNISFRMERGYPADIDHWIVNYDGQDASIDVIYEDDSNVEMAGAGEVVRRWNGNSATSLLESAAERVRFRQVIDTDNMNHLRTSLTLGRELHISDGYLIGWGCWPRRCHAYFGYVAIEISTGQAFAAYSTEDTFLTFGALKQDLPRPMLDMIESNQRRVQDFRK